MSRGEFTDFYWRGIGDLQQEADRVGEDRDNINALSGLIEQDRAKFTEIVSDFDRIVSVYNSILGIDSTCIPGMDNFQAVKPHAPRLPLLMDTLTSPLVTQETLGNLSTLMRRKDEGLGAPDTEWHHLQGEDTEAQMVYSAFRLYAEVLWREYPEAEASRRDAPGNVHLDRILDALIEVMPIALEDNSPVYDAVTNPDRLNWLADGGPFDPQWAAVARGEVAPN